MVLKGISGKSLQAIIRLMNCDGFLNDVPSVLMKKWSVLVHHIVLNLR